MVSLVPRAASMNLLSLARGARHWCFENIFPNSSVMRLMIRRLVFPFLVFGLEISDEPKSSFLVSMMPVPV